MSWTTKDKEILNKEYTDVMLHIALEIADKNKDWKSFNYIFNKSSIFLFNHLKKTNSVFDYNVFKLSKKEQEECFKIILV